MLLPSLRDSDLSQDKLRSWDNGRCGSLALFGCW